MIKIFLCNNGKYLENTCENNVNENINIKIDIYLYVYINIRNISSEIHLIIFPARLHLEMIMYIHSKSFVIFDYHLYIYERFDMEEFLLRITIQLFKHVIRNIIRLSWKGLSRTLLLHTIIECIVEWRNRLC